MSKNLVIVESPAKAKTIEKFLGSEFEVMSSYGHIRDLKDDGMGIDIENNFEPIYEISEDKQKTVRDLKNYKLSTPLISVHPHNLQPGDNVLVLPGIGLGFKEPAPIIVNNISTIMRHHDGWNSSFSLEG